MRPSGCTVRLRLAEVMEQPDQLEDRRLGDAGLDLPLKPLVQPGMISGEEFPKVG